MTVKQLYLIAALPILACGPTPGSSNHGVPTPRRTSTYLAADEILAAHAEGGTAWDVISRLRPSWLQRGTASFDPPSTDFPVVFVDGRRYGELETLRNIDANQIADARFFSVAEAGGRYGMQSGLSGVIEITLKK
jgi:hypothetical protein